MAVSMPAEAGAGAGAGAAGAGAAPAVEVREALAQVPTRSIEEKAMRTPVLRLMAVPFLSFHRGGEEQGGNRGERREKGGTGMNGDEQGDESALTMSSGGA
ncbi:hypothetical protein GCM10010277_01750 [Streptomyces longisporoflavus]|nr:hypothetical protein GCM10010277_01750 [Streptomyces longisporoflavus]